MDGDTSSRHAQPLGLGEHLDIGKLPEDGAHERGPPVSEGRLVDAKLPVAIQPIDRILDPSHRDRRAARILLSFDDRMTTLEPENTVRVLVGEGSQGLAYQPSK